MPGTPLATLLRVSRRTSYVLLAAIVAVPRLIALGVERGDILTAFTDKSDDFARTFLASGTYGFVAGHPSAYTQPLYGFFLVPIYWIFGREWWSVGFEQILVATGTAKYVPVPHDRNRAFMQTLTPDAATAEAARLLRPE